MWSKHEKQLIECTRCPRLIQHCRKIAAEKRKAFAEDSYWGKPVPSFGDKNARLVLIGLAPAAHGANRTGRMFTGDRSGEWLYRALFRAGFANQPTSTAANDGLVLKDAFITAAAHCAPPDNKPTTAELQNCQPYLEWELQNLTSAQVYLGLGKIGFDQAYSILSKMGQGLSKKPKFGHGLNYKLPSGKILMGTYHPSQQNTFTGRLTEPMFDHIFNTIRHMLADRRENSSVAR